MSELAITHVATTDLSDMLNPQGERRMELPGFDDEFVDFPDYIIRITDRIWHERNVELCLKYYSADCLIHTQSGQITGAQTVVDNTYATMASFPDRVLDADNVIWSKDAPQTGSDNPVFYSSHLITSKMTNLGPSEFGPATGKSVRVMTIADCACRDNVIFEEWLVRDYSAIVKDLGFDVDEVAAKLAQEDLKADKNLIDEHKFDYQRVQTAPSLSTKKIENPETNPIAFAESFFATIWQGQNYNRLPEFYDFRVGAKYPGKLDLYGPDQIRPVLENLMGALSELKFTIDHVADIPYLGDAKDVAVRWSLAGKHTGESDYGAPTHADIYLLGISHFRLMRGRIREEVTIWDDVALRRMIEGARLRG